MSNTAAQMRDLVVLRLALGRAMSEIENALHNMASLNTHNTASPNTIRDAIDAAKHALEWFARRTVA